MTSGYRVIESACLAKTGRPETNEDVLVLTPSFAMVIDGVTTKVRQRYTEASLTGGRLAALTLAAASAELDPEIELDGAVEYLSARLVDVLRTAGADPAEPLGPAATWLCYSAPRREIWRVGDGPFRLGATVNAPRTPFERVAAQTRAFYNRALLANGTSFEEVAGSDPGRTLVVPLLRLATAFQNYPDPGCPFGHGMLDGKPVPTRFRECFAVGATTELVLGSDGSPSLEADLAESETALAQIMLTDPLRIAAARPAAKGRGVGDISFDDRTYLRLAI